MDTERDAWVVLVLFALLPLMEWLNYRATKRMLDRRFASAEAQVESAKEAARKEKSR